MSPVRILSIALAVQIVLAVITWWPTDRSALLPHPLLDLPASAVDEIRIARAPSDDGEEVEWLHLSRDETGWKIASEGGYPASESKVRTVLDDLVGMKVGAPVATRASSHNALKVGDDEYGRRVVVVAGETERELWIGAALSNSVNVRLGGEDDVYLASGISEWKIQDEARSYWDSQYVSATPDDIVSLRIQNSEGALVFDRTPDGWTMDAVPEGKQVDSAAVDELLGKLTRLSLVEPVGSDQQAEHQLGEAGRVSWTIGSETESLAGGYAVGAEKDSNRYVKSDASPFVVLVGAASLEPLLEAKLDDFLGDAVPAEAAEAGGGGVQGG